MENCDLDVLDVQSDSEYISDFAGFIFEKRRRTIMGNIEHAAGSLRDMFTNRLTDAVNMFPVSEMEGRA